MGAGRRTYALGYYGINQPSTGTDTFQQMLGLICGGVYLLIIAGLIAAILYVFKTSPSPFLTRLAKGAIPLLFTFLLIQIWIAVSNVKGRRTETYATELSAYGSAPFFVMSILGLLSWIYLLEKKGGSRRKKTLPTSHQ
jgi:hypothetical protein